MKARLRWKRNRSAIWSVGVTLAFPARTLLTVRCLTNCPGPQFFLVRDHHAIALLQGIEHFGKLKGAIPDLDRALFHHAVFDQPDLINQQGARRNEDRAGMLAGDDVHFARHSGQ